MCQEMTIGELHAIGGAAARMGQSATAVFLSSKQRGSVRSTFQIAALTYVRQLRAVDQALCRQQVSQLHVFDSWYRHGDKARVMKTVVAEAIGYAGLKQEFPELAGPELLPCEDKVPVSAMFKNGVLSGCSITPSDLVVFNNLLAHAFDGSSHWVDAVAGVVPSGTVVVVTDRLGICRDHPSGLAGSFVAHGLAVDIKEELFPFGICEWVGDANSMLETDVPLGACMNGMDIYGGSLAVLRRL